MTPLRTLLLLATAYGYAGSPAAADDPPFEERVLAESVDALRAVAVKDELHVVTVKGSRCFYIKGKPDALSAPRPLDPEGPEALGGGERAPWIHVGEEATLVLWQVEGGLHLLRSTDEGLTWRAVEVVDKEARAIDMPCLIGDDETVFVVWVDGRRGLRGGDAVASELYMSASRDGGKTFGKDVWITRGTPGVCPCCQPSLALDAQGKLWISYRSSVRNQKEIQLLRVDRKRASAAQVSADAWAFNGCPMAGPSLAIAGQAKRLLVSWKKESDLYYALSQKGPSRFHPPLRLGGGTYHATASDGQGRQLLLWGEGPETGFRELWKGGRSGRRALAPSGYLLGLPGGGFLRVRGGP